MELNGRIEQDVKDMWDVVTSFNVYNWKPMKRGERMRKKQYWRDNDWEISQVDKRSQPTPSRRSMKPK